MRVKSPHAENPRFPAQRSSAQGESAPKAYKKTLITPAQAEDLLSPKVYQKMLNEGLVRQFQGKPVLVAASDNRPEIERIDDMFLLLSSLKRLSIFYLPTCVGLRYGHSMTEA